MELNITARHLKLTPAIAEYVQKKIEKAKRYFNQLIRVQVILDVEKNRHIAEVVVHAAGHTFKAKEESIDLYAAVDLASDRLDEQLRRFKEKRRLRRSERGVKTRAPVWSPSVEATSDAPDPRVSSMRVLRLVASSLTDAIQSMEESASAHWIFLNKETDRVTVVYRKPDKTFGVVESIA